MQNILIGISIAILAVASLIFVFLFKEPDLSQFEQLISPRILVKQDQKMLVVTAQGPPDVVAGKAFGLLFEAYFKLTNAPLGSKQPAPRARWQLDASADPNDWIGYYALPVPGQVENMPDLLIPPELSVVITTWGYGAIVEILHIGPYDTEPETIEKLKIFVANEGYRLIGFHEEEYLRGPGMFPPVNPQDFYTIIRYQVERLE
jgi:hypothetical protein